MSNYHILFIALLIIVTCVMIKRKDSEILACDNWQADMIMCKNVTCCKELRNKQPDMCFIPKRSCSIYE